ncbi:hypothetical protein BDV95DRAFT_586549 [Massariosphaeria phaeospora]|uniref:DUF4604 domain-containing protein n=1 Tax=Massariosphaeria phaeospora TaxID=100035 RepID=A0A7C8I1H2_9PLEO|nr:hypothetical protein BDV95DRAFT_586549 [Massariosphaeria phaeospora]
MSFKAKDLSYDASQPAFLRRLRGEMAGDDSVRHEQPIPRNKRMKKDEEEDDPTYVLEDTNQSLTKAEFEALAAGKNPKDIQETGGCPDDKSKLGEPAALPKDNIAEVGKVTKKRKAVKIISEEQDEGKSANPTGPKVTRKPKKKGKAVKLSFGDQE